MKRRLLILILLGLAAAGCATKRPLGVAPTPLDVVAPTPDEIHTSIDRGVAYLLASQLSDGSWGRSHARRMGIDTQLSSRADFEMATTALAVQSLIEVGAVDTPEGLAAVERGEAWILKHLPGYRYALDREMFNIWGHAYAIEAILTILEHRPMTDERRAEWGTLVDLQIRLLVAYESSRGGWGYYINHPVKRPPDHWALSFMTASVLITLHEAQEAGFDVPRGTVATGLRALQISRGPDGGFSYSINYLPEHSTGPNRGAGAMARTHACSLAMRLWGDPLITDDVFTNWLNRFIARIGWIDMERKKPWAHTGEYRTAGYYYYYGMYYAARVLEHLPEDDQPFYKDQLARLLVDRQDGDGTWWDFPLYDYFQGYGTALAIMSLQRCLPAEAPAPPPPVHDHAMAPSPVAADGTDDDTEHLPSVPVDPTP